MSEAPAGPLVRILKDWSDPDLLRQTPGGAGGWEGVRFTLDPVPECDYAVVLNRPAEDAVVRCPPAGVWALMQEPPNESYREMHRGAAEYARVYTQDPCLRGARYVHSQPALPWHVDRSLDFLRGCGVPEKPRALSWITSNLTGWQGHRERMAFLEAIRGRVEFDLFGRGFSPIADKWDGLAPYRCSLAIENFSGPYYWSEKLADCFLAWCLPLYYGCTQIEEYFPPEALVRVDIRHPAAAVQTIREVSAGDRWERSLEAIAEARRLVLEEYQLFPFLAGEVRAHRRRAGGAAAAPRDVRLKAQPEPFYTPRERAAALPGRLARRAAGRVRRALRGG